METDQIRIKSIKEIIKIVCNQLDGFIEWPKRAELLWRGCYRPDSKIKHKFPEKIKSEAKDHNIIIDSRSNGPAIMAFRFAGGRRPSRYDDKHEWNIHHLYSGDYPYIDRLETLHAVKSGDHFTQSAGLVAIHPLADALCHEYPFFAWYLRAKSYLKFGYNPDGVLGSKDVDRFGFEGGESTFVRYEAG